MTAIRVKALNDEVWTEMVRKDGKVFMNVYDGAGNLLDVMEEVASSLTPEQEAELQKKLRDDTASAE
ncbi:hypothetical protein [Undibacterium squillarum]|uniref:YD repeat-containing protein n=1 Tax=Undibacterium squillarum TaxID=1131567 RepID=A0ABQ2XUP5_9BURK|nr:hypothetical protein [Undibacterium squillarum]GGX35172.1 hypothetical protein GCM10010946_10650 [Undibacterium squillarum]